MTRALAALLLVVAVPVRGDAQGPPLIADEMLRVVLPGESRTLLGRFDAAARHAARAAWAEALDEYQRLIDEFGDELAPVDSPRDRAGSTRRSLQVRRLCHLRIAALPPAALRLYRARTDPRAEQWLRQGAEQRDAKVLRRIVEEAFCSRPAEQALMLLGDLAFERGEFAEARSWYRLLALPPTTAAESVPPGHGPLLYPDPAGDPAAVRARQVLALLFEGDLTEFAAELIALERLHPNARGKLAGRQGVYADVLKALRRERGDTPLSPEEDDWPTFGGATSRGRVLPAALSERLWAEGPAWRAPLRANGERLAAPRLAAHPVVAAGQVIFADTRRVTGLDGRTGRPAWHYDHAANEHAADGHDAAAAARELSHTLTASQGRVYARLGGIWVGPAGKGELADGDAPGCLVCLDVPTKLARQALEPRWVVRPKSAKGERASFEGAPLVHDGRAYAALTTVAGGKSHVALSAYDADKGTPLWSREVCVAPEFAGHGPRCRHHLLTLAGDALAYCTHAGAVVAVDARTGKRRWAVRYPTRPPAEPPPRPPAPCVAAGHRLFVAPLDSDRVLCLDAGTGRLLWEREGVEVVDVLGVAAGRLIFTTARGARAVDAATGDDAGGWQQPATGRLAGLGRGLLAADQFYWPTQDRRLPVRVLRAGDGEPAVGDPSRLHRLVPGNLAFGRGCLVIAGATELVAYRPR